MSANFTPEITVEDLAAKLNSADPFILLDIRENWEQELARIIDERLVILPMSWFASEGIKALPDSVKSHKTEIFVLCHHGIRSSDVTNWLTSQGWTSVFSVAGGINEYASKIDGSVGFY